MTAVVDRTYAARWDIDSARGHLDTTACLVDSATEHLDGARKTLDRITAALADLDRLRAAL